MVVVSRVGSGVQESTVVSPSSSRLQITGKRRTLVSESLGFFWGVFFYPPFTFFPVHILTFCLSGLSRSSPVVEMILCLHMYCI